MAWRFPVWCFFSVLLSMSMCISALGLSSSPSSSLVVFFFIQHFRYIFGCHIFVQIVRFLWHLVVGMFLCHSLPIVDRIFFRCFGISCFACIVLPFVSLIFLLSPALCSLFPQVVLLYFLCCLFLFVPDYFSASFLSFWLVFVVFYLRFSIIIFYHHHYYYY